MNNIEKNLRIALGGLQSAENYLCEDLEAICDDTMRECAEDCLNHVVRGVAAAEGLLVGEVKNLDLFLDALADISVVIGWLGVEFEDSKTRSVTLRSWAHEFVSAHADTDWESADYISLIDEFAQRRINLWLADHPKARYTVKHVFGTEAVREYQNAVDDCVKWDESALADLGAVTEVSFDTQKERCAYLLGVEDATGWLESAKMMTGDEWDMYCEEMAGDEDDD